MLNSSAYQKTAILTICLLFLCQGLSANQITKKHPKKNPKQIPKQTPKETPKETPQKTPKQNPKKNPKKKVPRSFPELTGAFGQLIPQLSPCGLSRTVFNCEKPIYRPGEQVIFRTHTFNLKTKAALMECDLLPLSVSIYDAQKKFIARALSKRNQNSDSSAATFTFQIPESFAGGVYFATLTGDNNSDQVSFFVNTFNQQKLVVLADWSSEFALPGAILKGKLTIKAMSRNIVGLNAFNAEYRFLNANGEELAQSVEAAVGGVIEVNFEIPSDYHGAIVFAVTVNTGPSTATYSKTFAGIEPKEVQIDFTVGSAKVVQGQKIRFYFQAYANSTRTLPLQLPKCRLVKNKGDKKIHLLKNVKSDEFGRGSFQATMYNEVIFGTAMISLVVEWSAGNESSYDVPISNIGFVSAVYMDLPKLVFKQTDNLVALIKSKRFTGELRLVIQDKTNLLYAQQFNYDFNEKVKKLEIPVADLNYPQGGVVNVQLYVNEKSLDSLTKNVKKPTEDNAVEVQSTESERRMKTKERSMQGLALPANRNGRQSRQSRPLVQGPSVVFQNVLLQEALVFLTPAKLLSAKAIFGKKDYLPKETVSVNVVINDPRSQNGGPTPNQYCEMIVVSDLNSFSKVESANQNPSLVTKLFLEKEVLVRDSYFPNAGRYIDELFLNGGQLSQTARTLLRNLLGNQHDRQLLFEPKKLQEYLYSKKSTKYRDLVSFFDYLIPGQRRGRSGNSNGRKRVKTVKNQPVNQIAVKATNDAPVAVAALPPNPSPITSQKSEGNYQDYLKKDTIFYQESICFSGKAQQKFSFPAPDLSTKYRVTVLAYNDLGFYGFSQSELVVLAPIDVVFSLPEYIYDDEVFYQDLIIINNLDVPQSVTVRRPFTKTIRLAARAFWKQRFLIEAKTLPITIEVSSARGYNFVKTFNVAVYIPGIYRSAVTSLYVLPNDGGLNSLSLKFHYPTSIIEKSIKLKICYLNDLAGLFFDALKRFDRIPIGCFEQMSSNSFPIVMALLILKKFVQEPKVIALNAELLGKLRHLLPKLLSYQTKDGGFEWFGGESGHTTLTAYGVFQLHMIAQLKIEPPLFDNSIFDKILDFFKKSRNENLGFKIRKGYDGHGNPDQLISDLYILFILATVYPKAVETFPQEFAAIPSRLDKYKNSSRKRDPYVLALFAHSLLRQGKKDQIEGILHEINQSLNRSTGGYMNAESSITRSTGESLVVETTALVLLIFLRYPERWYHFEIFMAVKFLSQKFANSDVMSTQATVLTLLALYEYANIFETKQKADTSFSTTVNNKPGEDLKVVTGNSFFDSLCIDLSGKDEELKRKRKNILDVLLKPRDCGRDQRYLIKIEFEYYAELPVSAEKSSIRARIEVNQASNLRTYTGTVQNLKPEGTGMVVWEFMKPSCYDLNINDLEALRVSGAVDYYETREAGRMIVFYWRGLGGNESRRFSFALNNPNFMSFDCVERTHSVYLYYDKAGSVQYLNGKNQIVFSGAQTNQGRRRRLRLGSQVKSEHNDRHRSLRGKRNRSLFRRAH